MEILNELDDNFFITKRAKVKGYIFFLLIFRPLRYKQIEVLGSGPRTSKSNVVTEDTEIERKLIELEKVQKELDSFRTEFQNQERKWKDREDLLRRKKQDFLKRINDMEIFTKKTAKKIEKFRKKYFEEKNLNEAKSKVIENLSSEIKALTEKKSEKEIFFSKVKPYEDYLNLVLEKETTFKSVLQVLKRYHTLKGANDELIVTVNRNKKNLLGLNHEIKELKKNSQNSIFKYNTLLRKNQIELEKKRNAIKFEEQNSMTKESDLIEITQLLSRVNMCINNLYTRCLETDVLNNLKIVSDNTEIKNNLFYLKIILRRIKVLKRINGVLIEESKLRKKENLKKNLIDMKMKKLTLQRTKRLRKKRKKKKVDKVERNEETGLPNVNLSIQIPTV